MSTKTMIEKTALVLGLLALTGCADMNNMEQRMLTGAAAGAAVGAAGTVLTGGCVACGAVIGGAVGTGAGYVMHEIYDK